MQTDIKDASKTHPSCTTRLFAKGLRRVRQSLIQDASLEKALEALIITIEEQFPEIIGSILLFDKEKKSLHHGSAPGLPLDFCQAIDGILIGPEAGSCGTAVFTGKRVIVEDIQTHPYWEPYRGLASKAGVQSCWSQPIFSVDNEVLGTFALYYKDPKSPTEAELQLLEAAAEIAGIAIEMKRDADALDESEDRFRTMADNIPNLAWMANADGWIFWYNKRWYEYTGTSPAEMEGWGWQSVHDPGELQKVMRKWKDSIATGKPFDMVFPLRGCDGNFRPFLTRVLPIKDDKDQVLRWFGTNTDISEQKAAEQALRRSEELLSDFFENGAVGLHWVGPDGIILRANQAELELLGYKPQEYIGHHISKFHADEAIICDILERLTSNEILHSYPARLRCKDGSIKHVLISSSVYRENGQFIHTRCFTRDITEQKIAEDALRESENRFRTMAEASSALIWLTDANGQLMYLNKKLLDYLGTTIEKIQEDNWHPYFLPEDIPAIEEKLKKALAGEDPYYLEVKMWHAPSKEFRWIITSGGLIYGPDGEISGLVGSAIDIHDRKVAEEALKQSEARLRAIVDTTPECIKIVSHNGTLEYMNASGLDMIEADTNILGKACVFDVIAPEYRTDWIKNHKRVCSGESVSWEFDIIGVQGSRRHMETHAVPLPAANGTNSQLAVTRDITERRLAEAALRESEEQFRTLANNAPLLIFITDAEGNTIYRNKTIIEFFGLQHYPDPCDPSLRVEQFVHSEDLVILKSKYLEAFNTHKRYNMELRLRRADGEYRWIFSEGVPRFDRDGKFQGYIGIALDLTDRKNSEEKLKLYAQQLELRNKELDQFTTMASHDLQAPLRKVQMFTDHLKIISNGSLSDECLGDIERIQRATTRMQNLITDLLTLSKVNRKGLPFKKVSLTKVVQEVVEELQQDITELNAQIEFNDLPSLEADKTQLFQLFQNLIQNALKFHQDGVIPIVKIYDSGSSESICKIAIEDNGIGIQEEYKDRIFEIFQRLHNESAYPGTGIGLSICKKIVERHNGTIHVESNQQNGSKFIVTLPVKRVVV